MNPNFIPLDAISGQPFDLDSVQIAKPCRADWNLMGGDDRVRHCQSCAKNVYNFSALTRAEAMRLIEQKEGNLCVQLHRRTDGTLITADCTVGVSALKSPRRALQNLLSGVLAAVLGAFGLANANAAPKQSPALRAPALRAPALRAPALRAPALRAPALRAPALRAPALGTPTMGAPMVPKRVAPKTTLMGEADLGVMTLGRMVSPSQTAPKRAKSHAKHSAKAVAKSKSALQYRRHRR